VQSKSVLHNTGKLRSGDTDVPPTIDETQPPSASDPSQGTPDASQSENNAVKDSIDLLRQTSNMKVREFTWDKTMPFPFVVVFSHAAVTVTLKDRGLTQSGVAQGTIAVSDLPQGKSTHALPMMLKGNEVCL
jgi:hypothetical protein